MCLPKVVVASLVVFVSACGVVGTGVVVEEAREVADFHGVHVCCALEAEIVEGEKSVVVRTDDNILPLITSTVKEGVLTFELDATHVATESGMRVIVRTPALDALHASGGSLIEATGIRTDTLRVVETGGSRVVVEGSARALDATLSGGSTLDARKLPVEQATVQGSGGANFALHASDEVVGSLSGGSALRVTGGAQVQVETSGGATVVTDQSQGGKGAHDVWPLGTNATDAWIDIHVPSAASHFAWTEVRVARIVAHPAPTDVLCA